MDKKAVIMLVVGLIIGGLVGWLVTAYGFGGGTMLGGTVVEKKVDETSGLKAVQGIDGLLTDPETGEVFQETDRGVVEVPEIGVDVMTNSYGWLSYREGPCLKTFILQPSGEWSTQCHDTFDCDSCNAFHSGFQGCPCRDGVQAR